MGPPVWRLDDDRNALASLKGEMDLWIIIQTLVYFLAGLLSIIGLLEHKKQLIRNNKIRIFMVVCVGLSLSLYLSSLISPSFIMTFTYSSFYLIGITCSLYLILESENLNVLILDYFSLLRNICFTLLIFVAIGYIIDIQFVGFESSSFGLRILGGRVASSGISALILYSISLYFMLIGYKNIFRSIIFMIVGLIFIYLSKTRSIYLMTIVITYSIFLINLVNKNSRVPVKLKPIIFFIFPNFLLIYLFIFIDSESLINFITRYNLETFKSFGGRIFIAEWIIGELFANPWGLGYVAGFRGSFLFQGQIHDVIAQRIGTAHNSYLEILIGAGWHALFLYLIVLGIAIKNFIKVLRIKCISNDVKDSNILGFILLTLVIIFCLIDSKFVLPTRNEFGIFWYIIGLSFVICEKALNQKNKGFLHNMNNSISQFRYNI